MKKLTILAFLIVLPFFNVYSQWTVQNVGSTNSLHAVQFKNALTGWAGGYTGTVYKTTNGGVSWIPQITGLPAGQYNSFAFANTSTGWAIGAYQQTGMTGYIYKTTNGGNNWTQQMTATNHILYTSYAYDSLTCWAAGTYLGTTAAIIKTINGGLNWTTQISGQYTPIRSIYFINSLTGWAAGNNTMLKTTNSGASWNPNTFSGDVYSLYFIDALTGWAGTGDGKLLKTTSGGISWVQTLNAGITSAVYSISFPNALTGYFTHTSNVFKTTNGGSYWMPMETGTTNSIEAISCPTVNNIFAAGYSGTVVYSTNGGGTYSTNTVTFKRNNLNKPITMNNVTYDTISVNFPKSINSNILDINVSIDTVINSIDSGLVFILNHNYIYDTLIYRAGGNGNNFIRTVLDDSALLSINAGTPPFTGSYRPLKPLSQFNYTSPNGLWILKIKESLNGERTGVIKSWGITVSYNYPISVNKISEIIPSTFELKQNYPNPFNPSTNIKYQIANSKWITLKIFDILGREVVTLVNEKQSPGVYEVTFDGSGLSSGMYFYKLVSGDFSETKKMVLIK
ncbi:MAG: T9SS type A sorting domain-containing protein [Ignavibacteriae bacterium]|nr:T9SS type A sorting domain-containing protein [Ignavibacteriota bacterium]